MMNIKNCNWWTFIGWFNIIIGSINIAAYAFYNDYESLIIGVLGFILGVIIILKESKQWQKTGIK